jgi:hypothetical protein
MSWVAFSAISSRFNIAAPTYGSGDADAAAM